MMAGRPLIEWVWLRARALPTLDRVVIATDAEEIAAVVVEFGGEAILTSREHGSGTERVSEVASLPSFSGYDIVVNIQGDEPFIGEDQVAGAVAMVRAGWDVGTVAAPVGSLEAFREPSVVKVVRNDRGGALYFSRAPIPHLRGGDPGADDLASDRWLRHIGVYAFTPEALRHWVRMPAGPLEAVERLEQLRPLSAGLGIGVAVVADAEGGIDTLEDAHRAGERLRRERESMHGETDA